MNAEHSLSLVPCPYPYLHQASEGAEAMCMITMLQELSTLIAGAWRVDARCIVDHQLHIQNA